MTYFDRWPGMCRKAAYGPSGFGSAYEPVEHDWRLLEREEVREESMINYVQQKDAPGYGMVTSTPGELLAHREVWYCTRCRTVEERAVPTP